MTGAVIDEVFRAEWPRLVAALVRDLRDLELAEDCASEAFEAAATAWADGKVPDRPGAWLLTTARRRAIDRVRRAGRYADKLALLEASSRSASAAGPHTMADDQLALLLGCCHPALAVEAQVALTLRSVAGLTTAHIARAFLVPEATMAKRLTRAKHKIRATRIPLTVPDREHLPERLDAVLHVIYLIFNEGHSASGPDDEPVRGELCDEALWLSELLARLAPERSEVLGLRALLLLTDARRAARLDRDGSLILLEDQDRSRWDGAKIETGLDVLRQAHKVGESDGIGPYTLQAAAASVHVLARDFEATDWRAIIEIYDRLIELGDSPVFRLNRAAARSYLDGPEAALAEIDDLAAHHELADYHYLHSARAELLRRLGRTDAAIEAYRRALDLGGNQAEHRFLHRRVAELDRRPESSPAAEADG
jgi:RNA polymerase sigma-70 factor (ECF subfamily)